MCTFTNTQQGSVTVVKDTVPNGPADFAFTATNGATPAGFTLDDDADPALSNTQLLTGAGGRPELCGDRDVRQRGRVLVDGPGVHRRRGRHHGRHPGVGWRRSGSTRARRSCARSPTPSRVRSRWSRTRCRTGRRTSRSPRTNGAIPGGASPWMTTPTSALSNTQLLTGLVDGQSYVVTETSANAAGFSLTGLAVHRRRGRHHGRHRGRGGDDRVRRGRDDRVHVHQHPAGFGHGGEGHGAERAGGLRVHRGTNGATPAALHPG